METELRETQRDTETETERHTQRERQRDIHRERERERKKKREEYDEMYSNNKVQQYLYIDLYMIISNYISLLFVSVAVHFRETTQESIT